MLEGRLKYCGDRGILQQGSRLAQGTSQSVIEANEDAARKPRLGEQSNFISLLQAGLLSLVSGIRQFWLIDLEIEPLQALDASDELRFREAAVSILLSSRGRREFKPLPDWRVVASVTPH
jgi:hypothetical protein